ncbi:histone-lysine N-methyltransferase, H3 lysine-79 specific-like [Leptidea sinapis]|uniref:histone-lysine N-methyltransferase, H3 lysine-79 specific-like n=1 Tax=Leptidea sinapis TaxID=189913 RepID=UPI0021C2DAEF|nr:histone-lysine N-methyltransferase, H3 lysine-79 specific-like [Leptidea sinapis]
MAEKDNTKVKEREFIVECIQLYRELSSLWNVKSKEYYDRDKKKADYETLLSEYKEMFPEASKDDVKKKFNSLRTNYRKEFKKHLQSMKSGSDLKKMVPTQQIFAKSAIAAIIMEGQLCLLHRNSVKINSPTVTITPSPTYTRSTPTPTNYNSTPSPRNSEVPREELPHYQQTNTSTVPINPSQIYARSTPTPTNYNSTPSPRNSEVPREELPHYQQTNTSTVPINPSQIYARSTPTPTNYNSTPSPRNSELPREELPHYQQNMYYSQQDIQQNMDNSQQENYAKDMSQYIKLNK